MLMMKNEINPSKTTDFPLGMKACKVGLPCLAEQWLSFAAMTLQAVNYCTKPALKPAKLAEKQITL
jgi:hypothetical protein